MVNLDHIYVIHCCESEKRLKNIEFQKEHNKLLNDKLEIWWTCKYPFSNIMANAMLLSNKSRYISNGAEVNVVRNFYNIIKMSYYRNFENVLIFEDDFSIINEDIFYEYIKEIPEDFDIIQLSYLFNNQIYDFHKLYNNQNKWIKREFGAWSNCGLLLSRKGMKYFINSIDKELQAADIPTFEAKNNNAYYGKTFNNDLNVYIPSVPLIYITGNESEIQKEDKKILYEHYNTLFKNTYNIFL